MAVRHRVRKGSAAAASMRSASLRSVPPGSFGPNSLWDYEVGAKGRLFDGRLEYQVDIT